jgi:hypothetical protein
MIIYYHHLRLRIWWDTRSTIWCEARLNNPIGCALLFVVIEGVGIAFGRKIGRQHSGDRDSWR